MLDMTDKKRLMSSLPKQECSRYSLIVYKLIAREIELERLEKWVYSEKNLELLLTASEYLEIISLNYQTQSSLYEAEKILRKYIDEGKYYEWSLRRGLQKIVDHSKDADKYISQCYDLYCDGYDFLDNIGLRFGLAIVVDDEKSCLSSHKKLLGSFYPAVADEANRVIAWLDSEEILLTGHSGEYQGIEYEDNRKADDKNFCL